jgi:type IV secretion system protein VirB9
MRGMGRRLFCLFGALVASLTLAGEGAEGPGPDRRIRQVTYNPNDVVAVEAVVGIVTHIVLEPKEAYVTHAFGDGKAWDFAVKGNHYFLKPVAKNADSNLTIVTDRRSYHFSLRLAQASETPPTFELRFGYPDSHAARSEESRSREVEEGFAKKRERPNLEYSMSGDLDIAPASAWDDREFTYFKFPPGRDLPAIYLVDADGLESVVNRHSAGPANEIVVVHKVASRWVLRLGTRALAVWNDAFSPEGRMNATRTASPDLTRVLWR